MTDDTPAPSTPATYPGEPGSLPTSVGANSCTASSPDRERLHPEPDEVELAYRARLTAEIERA